MPSLVISHVLHERLALLASQRSMTGPELGEAILIAYLNRHAGITPERRKASRGAVAASACPQCSRTDTEYCWRSDCELHAGAIKGATHD